MLVGADEAEFAARLGTLLSGAAARLAGADARDEVIANYRPAGMIPFIKRAPVLLPVERAWRLGVLLLDRQARLFETGEVTRAIETKWPSNRSLEVERRRQVQAAAFRGPFEAGDVINVDATPIDLAPVALRVGSGPLSVRDGVLVVRWASTPGGGTTPLEPYLADRIALLAD
ncbi:hypothetical protein [Plantibacter sp. YIM 135249]|uniref:hypothetical protein n=1 Tax=Plantibacter sp. YIM 135249 TaxID=3423918 RepID=UPI003D3351BA